MTLLMSGFGSCAQMVLSNVTNEVYIGISASHTETMKEGIFLTNDIPFAYNDNLSFMPFCQTGAVELLYPSERSLFIKFQMKDSSGKEVPKTADGLEWGSDVENFPVKPTRSKHDRMLGWLARGSHTNGMASFMNGPWLPSPDSLFLMDRGDIYSLTMEVHLMKQRLVPGGWTWDHLVIPAVSVRVVKPQTAPFFAYSGTNHGICIRISGTKTNGSAAFDEGLTWGPDVTDTQNVVIRALDFSAGLKLRLWGPDGKEALRTTQGRMIGSNFDAVRNVLRLPKGTSINELHFTRGAADPMNLPWIEDCFEIPKPGIYTLELQMQFFRGGGFKSKDDELIRFPPMTLKVSLP